ncbi:MAG: cysteine desulfurase family protein [Candidatus Glassbacteria bacterium]
MERIYMDHNATTPLDPRVLEAMLPYQKELFGNPSSSTHDYGRIARMAVVEAREKVASLIGSRTDDVIFTSGATEADNLAIKGVAWSKKDEGNHIITSSVEHKAVLDTCKYLQKNGFRVTFLPVDKYGMVNPSDVEGAITDKTILVSVMHVNSEVGTVNPIEEIGKITKEHGVLFHCDAVQGVGKLRTKVDELNVDLMSISAHKIYGPKGVGALYVRKGVKLVPMMHGGGHERNLRSGTLNVPGIVGLGEACVLREAEMEDEAKKLTRLRQRMRDAIETRIEKAYLNGHPEKRQPGNLNFSFEYVEGEALILSLKDVAVSSGSACTSDSLESSYVLLAMGVPEALAHCSVRFGLGKDNTEEEVDRVVDLLEKNVARLRELSPLTGMKIDYAQATRKNH